MACTFAFKVFSVPVLSQWQASKHCAQDGARLAVFKVCGRNGQDHYGHSYEQDRIVKVLEPGLIALINERVMELRNYSTVK